MDRFIREGSEKMRIRSLVLILAACLLFASVLNLTYHYYNSPIEHQINEVDCYDNHNSKIISLKCEEQEQSWGSFQTSSISVIASFAFLIIVIVWYMSLQEEKYDI